jgi:hypothetical protein
VASAAGAYKITGWRGIRRGLRSHRNHALFSFGASRTPSLRWNQTMRSRSTILPTNSGQSPKILPRAAINDVAGIDASTALQPQRLGHAASPMDEFVEIEFERVVKVVVAV